MALLWVDLETTGLSSEHDRVLEIAAIVTDDALHELGRFHAVTNVARGCAYAELHSAVQDMHNANGLWMESLRSNLLVNGKGDSADDRFQAFIQEHCGDTGERKGPQLAGNTVSFDREFMRVHLPESFKLVHYRSLDVTGFNETAKRFWPAVYESRPRGGEAKHRAMSDIEESIAVYRHYLASLAPVTQNHDGTGASTVTITQEIR